jgi:ketosteroid isomerase-like protein
VFTETLVGEVSDMSAQDDAAVIRAGYEAFGKGDIEAVMAIFADDIRWHIPGRGPLAGDYRGGEEVLGFLGRLQELSGGSFRLEMHDLLASDDHVVALVTEIADRGDKSLSESVAHVWHLRDGKATEFWGLPADLYAIDEFWS